MKPLRLYECICSIRNCVCVFWQTPSFSRVQPDKGPVSGGTRLTVSGRHLDAGSAVTVFLAQETCVYVRWGVHPERIGYTSHSTVCLQQVHTPRASELCCVSWWDKYTVRDQAARRRPHWYCRMSVRVNVIAGLNTGRRCVAGCNHTLPCMSGLVPLRFRTSVREFVQHGKKKTSATNTELWILNHTAV